MWCDKNAWVLSPPPPPSVLREFIVVVVVVVVVIVVLLFSLLSFQPLHEIKEKRFLRIPTLHHQV